MQCLSDLEDRVDQEPIRKHSVVLDEEVKHLLAKLVLNTHWEVME
jgi:hypothetical protein